MPRPKKKKLTIELAAKRFLEFRAKKAIVERKLDELSKFLKPILKASPTKSFVMHSFLFQLEESVQDYFKLSEAKKKIPLEVLKPFINATQIAKIRTKFIGESEELLAA